MCFSRSARTGRRAVTGAASATGDSSSSLTALASSAMTLDRSLFLYHTVRYRGINGVCVWMSKFSGLLLLLYGARAVPPRQGPAEVCAVYACGYERSPGKGSVC